MSLLLKGTVLGAPSLPTKAYLQKTKRNAIQPVAEDPGVAFFCVCIVLLVCFFFFCEKRGGTNQ